MVEYTHKFYRDLINASGLRQYRVDYAYSDIFIATDIESSHIPVIALDTLTRLYSDLDHIRQSNPEYISALSPIEAAVSGPADMDFASRSAGTGPMSAVAGYFADCINRAIRERFNPDTLIVENGGDISAWSKKDIRAGIFAGESALSGRLNIIIPFNGEMKGICTSSATVGHSLSFGKADSVTIICDTAALADAYATQYCNRLMSEEDLNTLINEINRKPDIRGALLVFRDSLAAAGALRLAPEKEAV